MTEATTVRKRSIADIKLNLDFFIHFFGFLSVLLIGADRWGISALGVNLRVDQLFLLIFSLLLFLKGEFRITKQIYLFLFFFSAVFSTVFAINYERSVLFFASILYNIFFLFYTFSNYVRAYGIKHFLNLWRKTCYVQFGIIFLQFILEVLFHFEIPNLPIYGYYLGIPRFQIWFYEPSYLANYLVFWFAFSCYMWLICKQKDYLLDIVLALMMFLMSTSTSGFVGIAFVVFTVYLIWLKKGVNWKKVLFPFLILVLFLLFRILFSHFYEVFITRLFGGSLDAASGGRISMWAETWKVFLENPIFGIGPGNYGNYFGKDSSYVPSNVTLELLATMGIFGFLGFYGLTASLISNIRKLNRKQKSENTKILSALAYALVIFTIILQINQGYLRLYHWMFFGVLWGGILLERKRQIQ